MSIHAPHTTVGRVFLTLITFGVSAVAISLLLRHMPQIRAALFDVGAILVTASLMLLVMERRSNG
jgi:hypothetical protein